MTKPDIPAMTDRWNRFRQKFFTTWRCNAEETQLIDAHRRDWATLVEYVKELEKHG